MNKTTNIHIEDKLITIINQNGKDFISLTDMVRDEEGKDHIRNWMRNRNTVEFLGLWETLHNPNFKGVEFDTFRQEAGLNSFSLTPRKWTKTTGAIGIISKSGRYGGTYAHKDLAFEFGGWISPMFKLLLIKEFQRLKESEADQQKVEWDVKRMLAKTNFGLQNSAIKKHIIPSINLEEAALSYREEADLLNLALFKCTANDWREANPEHTKRGKNLRDFATLNELVVLSNLAGINSVLIRRNVPQVERFYELCDIADLQLKSLDRKTGHKTIKRVSSASYLKARSNGPKPRIISKVAS